MEEKGLIICDSDVIIEFFDRANKSIENRLVEMGRENLCISSVTYSEIIFGSIDKDHLTTLSKGLEKFIVVDIDQRVDTIHRELVKKYSLSHKLGIQDALIAATALNYEIKLFTLNTKDFKFIEGLELL